MMRSLNKSDPGHIQFYLSTFFFLKKYFFPFPFPRMRLFTHNFLQCHVRTCSHDSFPLKFENAEVQTKTAEFNPEFLALQLCKIDYPALLSTLQDVNQIFLLLLIS